MAANGNSNVLRSPNKSININLNCKKCKKVVKNGILCCECDRYIHYRCAKIDPSLSDNVKSDTTWSCEDCTIQESHMEQITQLREENANLKAIIEALKEDIIHLQNRSTEQPTCFTTYGNSIGRQNEWHTVQGRPNSQRWRNQRSLHKRTDSITTSNRFATLDKPNRQDHRDSEQTRYTKKTRNNEILLFGDSHGRGITEKINSKKKKCGTVKPGAPCSEVLREVNQTCKHLDNRDNVVIICGTNDVARNNSEKAVNSIKYTLGNLTYTNVVVVNIPQRHDLPDFSIVNKEVKSLNNKLSKICSKFKNVKMIDVNELDRNMFTQHGLHLNTAGKNWLAKQISSVISSQASEAMILPIPPLPNFQEN